MVATCGSIIVGPNAAPWLSRARHQWAPRGRPALEFCEIQRGRRWYTLRAKLYCAAQESLSNRRHPALINASRACEGVICPREDNFPKSIFPLQKSEAAPPFAWPTPVMLPPGRL